MSTSRVIARAEVEQHATKKDLWMIIHGKVYELTKYAEEHPGGIDALVELGGQDGTPGFEDVGHSEDARETLHQYLVGDFEGGDSSASSGLKGTASHPPPVIAIAPASDPVVPKKTKELSRTSKIALDVLIAGAVVFAGYEIWARTPRIGWLHHSEGGFWRGFAISSTAFFSLTTAVALHLRNVMNIDPKLEFHQFPATKKYLDRPARHAHAVGFLKPQEYQKLPLVRKDQISADTLRLSFALPTKDMVIGLPIGQHVAIRATVDGEMVSRSYTPVSNNSDPGELNLVIKMYAKGKLTGGYLQKLSVGDQVEFRGPKGAMRYRKGMAKSIGMVAGGTGITPMYQLIRAIVEDPTDNTEVTLLYGSTTDQDILLKSELDAFERKSGGKFKVHYVLSNAGPSWKGLKGFVGKDLIREKFNPPSSDGRVMLCGPPPMVNSCKQGLIELGFDKPGAVSKKTDQVFLF